MEAIVQEFETLRKAVDSSPEVRARYQAGPQSADVNLSSIRALRRRIHAKCQELRNRP